MDWIALRNMQFYGYHGALPEEHCLGQRFRVTLEMAIDLRPAGTADDLNQTINYAEAYELVRQIVEGEPRLLIEAVAETIASSVLARYDGRAVGCRVTVIKPDPPIAGHYDQVEVSIERGRVR